MPAPLLFRPPLKLWPPEMVAPPVPVIAPEPAARPFPVINPVELIVVIPEIAPALMMPSPFRLSAAPAPLLVIDTAAVPSALVAFKVAPPEPVIAPVPAARPTPVTGPPVEVIAPLAPIVVAPAIEPAFVMPELLLFRPLLLLRPPLKVWPPEPVIAPVPAARPLPVINPVELIVVIPEIAPALMMPSPFRLSAAPAPLLVIDTAAVPSALVASKVAPPEPVIAPVPAARPFPVINPVELIVVIPEIAPALMMPSPFRLSAAPAPLLVIDTAAVPSALFALKVAPPVPVINPLAPIVVAPEIAPARTMPSPFRVSAGPEPLLMIDTAAVEPVALKAALPVAMIALDVLIDELPVIAVLLMVAPVIVTVFPLPTGAPAAPPLDIVPVTCANAGPTAKGATRAVEAMSCVRSARLIRARVPFATVPVDVMRFTSLEIFILVPRYICTS